MPTSEPTRPGAVDPASVLLSGDAFAPRHLGPSEDERKAMLRALGLDSLEELIRQTVPQSIQIEHPLRVPEALDETVALEELREMAARNRPLRSLLGLGYHATRTPAVIQRNILENPGWYTQYTPYQAEISQGRLEALLNFQTMVADLTALPLANASLLDEATAAAEAMGLAFNAAKQKRHRFFVDADTHPQTKAVVRTRAEPLDIEIVEGDPEAIDATDGELFGALLSYPASSGRIRDLRDTVARVHEAGALAIVATDLLALTLIEAPGEFGADVAVGSAQRFGVPMGYGGPHAGFLATRDEFKRLVPGRIIGMSVDAAGRPALRLAMQTREQHIRRDKATSNICTAQVLLAIMAGAYAVYHGPDGLRRIARRVHGLTEALRRGLLEQGHHVEAGPVFDTLRLRTVGVDTDVVLARALDHGFELLRSEDGRLGVALDEWSTLEEVRELLDLFAPDGTEPADPQLEGIDGEVEGARPRRSSYLTHTVFHRYHAEHEMLRYLHRLQSRDLSLTHSMIPLGSCTMKLNATSEMLGLSWPEWSRLHPFTAAENAEGYAELFERLTGALAEITGLPAVSLQPNAGAQGEYTGLLVIRAWHRDRGQPHRRVCLIPVSAHGTNPASAVMAGMKVVAVACDDRGNIDMADLEAKAAAHADQLAAMMITYPSTHGVFEEGVRDLIDIVHRHGGLVYMDGANMNAQVGITRPGDMGADVCHLNLHKTFAIPHGGGGPGMGPIAVSADLAPYLPGHPLVECGGEKAIGPVAAAPYGSPSILTISWMYIRMLGTEGLRAATATAILNANYMAHRLRPHYPILYTGRNERVAHEFILDTRAFKDSAGVSVDDIAKRLMDYGFHAPTMSWPVAGTLMVEPTESESKAELDRFCDAMIAIREEIREIEEGRADREDNVLHNAPHTVQEIAREDWPHPYTREKAAFPAPWLREGKFFPCVGRVDNAYGDRHLVCTCVSVEEAAG